MNRFYKSIVFKGFLFFLLFALILATSMIGTVLLVSKKDIEHHTFEKLVLTGEVILEEIDQQQAYVESSVIALARIGAALGTDIRENRALVKTLLEHSSIEGGGIWPLPSANDKVQEPNALFFARDVDDKLVLNDSYNQPEAKPYVLEPWFTSARSLTRDSVHWSKVYTDPHTMIPMVTVSSPIYSHGKFVAVATVDIGLSKIDPLLRKISERIGGYTFLLDSHNKIIAFPQENGMCGEDFSNILKKNPMLKDVDHLLKKMKKSFHKNESVQESFVLEKDPYLNVKSFGLIYHNGRTLGRLGIVVPYENAFAQSTELLKQLVLISLIVTFLITLFGYLIVRHWVINPIRHIFTQLISKENQNIESIQEIETDQEGEIGLMVTTLNERTASLQKHFKQVKALEIEIKRTLKEVVFTMGAIGEIRSKETGNHVKRVAEYSKLLAHYYGLGKEECELLKEASPMHDIGKIAIPDAVLNKPGILDDDERKVMDGHTQLGYDMLNHSQRPLLKAAAIVAYEHHEHYDGMGYPRGLKGEEIHIYGRITTLADVFDALGSERVYKKAWDDEKIWAYFRAESGKQFDPVLVDLFFEHLDAFLKIRDTFQDI